MIVLKVDLGELSKEIKDLDNFFNKKKLSNFSREFIIKEYLEYMMFKRFHEVIKEEDETDKTSNNGKSS